MQLTLEEAATRLGKSRRQVLYMIRQDRLPARKIAGHWFIDSDDLPLNEDRHRRSERKQRQFKAAVEEALEVTNEDMKARYSVRDLKALQITLPLYRKTCADLDESHPAALALRRVLEHLCRGCHRFERTEKAESYRAARDAASLAICELLLADSTSADTLIQALEQDLMAALAGLMRRMDTQRRRRG
jgi:hypothetical protein